MKGLSLALAMSMIQVVTQVAMVLLMPVGAGQVPVWAFAVMPLIVFGGCMVMVVRHARKIQRMEALK